MSGKSDEVRCDGCYKVLANASSLRRHMYRCRFWNRQ